MTNSALKNYRFKINESTIVPHKIITNFKVFQNFNDLRKSIEFVLKVWDDYITEEDLIIQKYDWDNLEWTTLNYKETKNKIKEENV